MLSNIVLRWKVLGVTPNINRALMLVNPHIINEHLGRERQMFQIDTSKPS